MVNKDCDCQYCKSNVNEYFCITCKHNFNGCESIIKNEWCHLCPKCHPISNFESQLNIDRISRGVEYNVI
jgi:hypothetical protein